MSEPEQTPTAEMITLSLHVKHWIIVLAAIEGLHQSAAKKIERLRSQGVDHTTLPPEQVTALAGPMMVRGIIVKELTARGVMTPEANQQLGIDRIMGQIKKFRDED